jgi:hypothetical protein
MLAPGGNPRHVPAKGFRITEAIGSCLRPVRFRRHGGRFGLFIGWLFRARLFCHQLACIWVQIAAPAKYGGQRPGTEGQNLRKAALSLEQTGIAGIC